MQRSRSLVIAKSHGITGFFKLDIIPIVVQSGLDRQALANIKAISLKVCYMTA